MLRLSYTHLAVYESCPKKFHFRFVENILPGLGAKTYFGTILHNTLQKFYERIIELESSLTLFAEHAPDISLSGLLELYESCWISNGFSSIEEEQQYQKLGKEILIAYYEKHQNDFGKPLLLEKSFSLTFPNATISGRIDRIDRFQSDPLIFDPAEIEIIDYKSGSIRENIEDDLQLHLYAIAAKRCFQLHPQKASLYFLKDNQKCEVIPTLEKMSQTEERIYKIIEGIQKEQFPTAPLEEKCSRCEYRQRCFN